jgi:hypothetical protein
MSYYLQNHLSFHHPCILNTPQQELSIVVVIPCFNRNTTHQFARKFK